MPARAAASRRTSSPFGSPAYQAELTALAAELDRGVDAVVKGTVMAVLPVLSAVALPVREPSDDPPRFRIPGPIRASTRGPLSSLS